MATTKKIFGNGLYELHLAYDNDGKKYVLCACKPELHEVTRSSCLGKKVLDVFTPREASRIKSTMHALKFVNSKFCG